LRSPQLNLFYLKRVINTNTNKTKPFATVEKLSYFQDENEILFFIGSIVRIEIVEKRAETDI
jgi:hypothetical protein